MDLLIAVAAAAFVFVNSVAAPVVAANEPSLIDDVTRCRAVIDVAARLACYDKTVGNLASAAAKQDVVVLDRDEVRRTRRSLFGFALPKLPIFENREGDTPERDEMRSLQSTLRSVRPAGYGLWTLVLVDGGTWQTAEASRALEPRSGQTIHVKSGPLGGYMANIDGGRAVRVRRIG